MILLLRCLGVIFSTKVMIAAVHAVVLVQDILRRRRWASLAYTCVAGVQEACERWAGGAR